MSQNPIVGLIRKEWMSASHFHELTEAEVLLEVAVRVEKLKAAAAGRREAHPLVLLDLDSTLYEVGPRTYQILREWAQASESAEHALVRDAVFRAEPWHVGYSVRDTLKALDVDADSEAVAPALSAIKDFWTKRFFTSEYLKYDHAYPGAASFTQKLHDLGAEIVYLTGRDEPNMGDGTRAMLVRDGFPWDLERTHLLLKKAAHLPDLEHKMEAAHYVRQHGTLVASFENEPPNLVALSTLFPDAMHVFVDTVCSDHPAPVGKNLYRIKGFGA
jgi:phosphoglycolate phosphatase-like HAD superfamily hydrolase